MCVSQGRIREGGEPKANMEEWVETLCQAKETEGNGTFLVEGFTGARKQDIAYILKI